MERTKDPTEQTVGEIWQAGRDALAALWVRREQYKGMTGKYPSLPFTTKDEPPESSENNEESNYMPDYVGKVCRVTWIDPYGDQSWMTESKALDFTMMPCYTYGKILRHDDDFTVVATSTYVNDGVDYAGGIMYIPTSLVEEIKTLKGA